MKCYENTEANVKSAARTEAVRAVVVRTAAERRSAPAPTASRYHDLSSGKVGVSETG